ncbi:MAG TPA: CHAP domain-containing protein, partial [Acidimicrobiia bacterium]
NDNICEVSNEYDSTASGVTIGMKWQCVELVNRLYLAKGWTHSTWWGNGNQMYANAPSNLAKQPQGSITNIGPGDVVSYAGGDAGHVGIVDTVTANGSGGYTVSLVNQNAVPTRTTTTLRNGVLTAPWSGFSVIGVIDAPGSVSVGNGSFVTHDGFVYRIAGGAPLYVSNWANVGGPQPTTALSDAQFDALAKYPANGTTVVIDNSNEHGAAFVFAGGAPLVITNWDNVPNHHFVYVDGNALDTYSASEPWDHVSEYPADGTPVAVGNSQSHGEGFVFAGGAPLAVQDWSNVANHAFTFVDGNALINFSSSDPYKRFSHVRQYPANGTAVAVGNPVAHGSGYDFAGGAPIAVSNWAHVGTPHFTVVDSIALDNYSSTGTWRAFEHVRAVPANGTFLRSPTTGAIYRAAGGAPLYISNCTPIGGCAMPGPVDTWAIANAGQANVHLSAVPADNTIVEGMPSHHYWKFENGKRTAAASTASAVVVDDTSVTRYPVS